MKPVHVCLVALLICFNLHSQTTLFPFGSSWKYLDDGSDQSTAWRAVGFDDAAWKSGISPLGFGDGDEATVTKTTPVTTYFRKVVNIQNPSQYNKIILEFKRDDGSVIFINGTKRSSSNMPSTVTYLTNASTIAGSDGNTITTVVLSPTYFVNGNNTIAVEVHQAIDATVDLSFDFQLKGNLPPLAKAGTDKTIKLPTNTILLDGASSTDPDGTIKKYAWTKVSGPATGTLANAATSQATASDLSEGIYVYRLTVTDNIGALGKDDVTITVSSNLLFVDWKNTTFPSDGLPDGRRFANDRLRSSTAYDAFNRIIVNDKLKIVVDSNVPVDPAVSSAQYHYRAEFTEWPWRIHLPEGTEQWFGWSYYFSADYVRGVTPITIFQNHAAAVSDSHPLFQLELSRPGQIKGALGGEIQVVNICSEPKVRKLTAFRPKPGDRVDIICHVVYGRGDKGLLEFWFNGVQVHSQIGSNIFAAPENWGGNNKWGIYHHSWDEPLKVQQDIAAGHTKFELLMGNLRQITRAPNDPAYLSNSKSLVDPAQDVTTPSSARTDQSLSDTNKDETPIQDGLYAYPSPVRRGDDIQLKGDVGQTFEVAMINQSGQLMKKLSITDSGVIATDDLPSGLYILRAVGGNQNQIVKIIVTE
jgi:Polysaccharide lyase